MIFILIEDKELAGLCSQLLIVNLKSFVMLRWTIIFLVIALIAALLGFTGVASGAAAIAKIFFYIFIVLFLISVIAGGFRRS
jgi:uncharacterized membrane protein YtjA (UPF0391 family)